MFRCDSSFSCYSIGLCFVVLCCVRVGVGALLGLPVTYMGVARILKLVWSTSARECRVSYIGLHYMDYFTLLFLSLTLSCSFPPSWSSGVCNIPNSALESTQFRKLSRLYIQHSAQLYFAYCGTAKKPTTLVARGCVMRLHQLLEYAFRSQKRTPKCQYSRLQLRSSSQLRWKWSHAGFSMEFEGGVVCIMRYRYVPVLAGVESPHITCRGMTLDVDGFAHGRSGGRE